MVYDQIYSLGQWCATAIYLKKFGLRSGSGPFDWLGYGVPLKTYLDIITAGFGNFPDVASLEFIRESVAEGKRVFRDRPGFSYPHDFRIGGDFAAECRVLSEKTCRRARRMLEALADKKVLLVHWHGAEKKYDRGEVWSALTSLRCHFHNDGIDLLVLENGEGDGVRFEPFGDGLTFAVGDFYAEGKYDPVLGNRSAVDAVFSSIKMRGRWRNFLHNRITSLHKRIKRLV